MAEILAAVDTGVARRSIQTLNRWLTEHNEYNTSENLHSIGNDPHECLGALESRIGYQGGPSATAMPRPLRSSVTGWKFLVSSLTAAPAPVPRARGRTTCNHVLMPDGQWYGVDVT